MKIEDFLSVMKKVARLRVRLEQENFLDIQRQIILKVYIQELAPRINTTMLEVI